MKAHFDGKVIVPDEPVDLPVDKPLNVDVREPVNGTSAGVLAALETEDDPEDVARRLQAFEEFLARVRRRPPGPRLSNESLRREYIYGDDGR